MAEPQCKAEAKPVQPRANLTSKPGPPSLLGDLPALNRRPEASRQRKHRPRQRQRRRSGTVDDEDVPTTFLCAINGHMLQHPVRAPSGLVFERSTIEHWLSLHGSVCPLTHEPLSLTELEPDTETQLQIVEWTLRRRARDQNHGSRGSSLAFRSSSSEGGEEDGGTDACDWDIYDFA